MPSVQDDHSQATKPTARYHGRAWHGRSRFASADDFRPIDRNDRWRVWGAAEALEKRTKQARKHGGVLGHTGLIVLRCLLFDFLNIGSGRLDPSYEAIAGKTNLARDTVIEAVKRLSIAGILELSRRIIRAPRPAPGWHRAAGVSIRAPARGATWPTGLAVAYCGFRSAPPHEGRRGVSKLKMGKYWFRSAPPHEGRQGARVVSAASDPVSIRAPARGATLPVCARPQHRPVSIRAPARGAT